MTLRNPAMGGLAALSALLGLAATTCIIPDRDISAEEVLGNEGAVRIVEAINLPSLFLSACERGSSVSCPQVPTGRRSGLLTSEQTDPDTGEVLPFCICPEDSSDERTIDGIFVYAEDPDRAARNDERIYAVALLDLDTDIEQPQQFVAFEQHLEPGQVGEAVQLDTLPTDLLDPRDISSIDGESLLSPSLERPDSGLVRFRFGKNNGEGTDLCNDNNGTKLAAGLHTLQIMVTDRPFFRPLLRDTEGNPVLGLDGQPQRGAVQHGMPDLAAGATWSVTNYVFECVAEDPETPADASVCDCSEPQMP